MAKEHMGRLEWSLLIVLSVFWGASFFFYKLLVSLGPFTVVLGRMGIAAAVMVPVLYARGRSLPPLRNWGPYFVLAHLNCVVPFSLFAYSERHITSGLASIINAMTPIFTVIVAHFWTHNEKLVWNKAIGIGFGLIGVVIVIGPAALADIAGKDTLGEICCLLATVSYGFSGVYGKRFGGQPLDQVVTGQTLAATILIAPLALLIEQPWTLPAQQWTVWASLAGIALVSTVAAYLIYFHILAKGGATNVSLVTFLVPVSSVFLGVAFLGESVSTTAIAGVSVIALGLAAIDGRPLQWLRRRRDGTA
jgi:drug/metabolite transporter (DMT)-like permease